MNYSCPSWEDFPDIYLYMDQAISVLEKHLAPFSEEKTITSTMINNYVKQKIIEPPQNKKYSKEAVADIFMVCILKRFMQISDAKTLISKLCENRDKKEAFLIFKREFDMAMKNSSKGQKTCIEGCEGDAEEVLRASLIAFASIQNAREKFLSANAKWQAEAEEAERERLEKAEKEKKEKEKEKEEKKKK